MKTDITFIFNNSDAYNLSNPFLFFKKKYNIVKCEPVKDYYTVRFFQKEKKIEFTYIPIEIINSAGLKDFTSSIEDGFNIIKVDIPDKLIFDKLAFKKIFDYYYYKNIHADLDKFDLELDNFDNIYLLNLTELLRFLNCNDLVVLCCAIIIEKIKKMTFIKYDYGADSDFTPEEESRIAEENKWIDEENSLNKKI